MVSGAAALVAMLVGFIVSAVLIGVAWRAVRSGVDLAKGDADTAFWRALKVFVLLSFVTGAMVFGAVHERGLHRGLRGLYEAICAVFGILGMLFFLMALAGQVIALVVLLQAWRRRN